MTDVAPLIRRSPVPMSKCNLARSFGLIGDRWSLLVLRSALYGVRRFDDFQAELKAPRSVLSNRLAALVANGLIARREYRDEGKRARIEYPLTAMGQALGLPFMAMTEWADRWIGNGHSPLMLRRKSNGQVLRVALVDQDGRVTPASDIDRVVAVKKPKPGKSKRK
jgi:DNA-binding HxlR family transcriptional regulator